MLFKSWNEQIKIEKNQKNAYLKITKILNIIKVLDILLMAEIS